MTDAATTAVPRPGQFAIRGVIEGFYGPIWSMQDRLELIRFIARHHMNFYGYAPKADPLCRINWDTPFPPDDLAGVAELSRAASALGISLAYGLSPGISICYSNPDDRVRLLAKLDQLVGAGLRHFMLLFDDLPPDLQHPADLRAYGSLVEAQADLINFVHTHLRKALPQSWLAVCPTLYCGRGDEPYIRQLGAQLDRDVEIFWTGRTVWANEIDSRDARYFRQQVGRSPLYWDNYPANDLFMSNEAHIGPYRGRDPDLDQFARGIVVNPMTLLEASKIPLATIGDYLFAPGSYDAEVSWNQALAEVGGPNDSWAWRLFADNIRTSCLEVGESPLLTAALERARFAARFGTADSERAVALALLGRFTQAAEHLLGQEIANPALARELRPWLEAFAAQTWRLQTLLSGQGADPGPQSGGPRVFSSLALADLLPEAIPGGAMTGAPI